MSAVPDKVLNWLYAVLTNVRTSYEIVESSKKNIAN
jgi:hypothetical protein